MKDYLYNNAQKAGVGKVSFWKEGRKYLYVSRFDGMMYRLDGKDIDLVTNGSDNIYLRNSHGDNWQKFNYTKTKHEDWNKWDEFMNFMNFTELSDLGLNKKEQRMIFEQWLTSLFFLNQSGEKTILLCTGPAGSGKTLCLELILKTLFGEEAMINQTPLDRRSLIANVNREFLYMLDNLEGEPYRGFREDFSRFAMKQDFAERKLHTDMGTNDVKADCFLAVSSIYPRFSKTDFASRCLWLDFEKVEDRAQMSRDGIHGFVTENRDALMSVLLEKVNRQLGNWKMKNKDGGISETRGHRIRSFSKCVLFGCNRDKEKIYGDIFEKLRKNSDEQSFMMTPMYKVLKFWYGSTVKKENEGIEMSTNELYEELSRVARENLLDRGFYQSCVSFSRNFWNNWSAIKEMFHCHKLAKKTKNKKYVRFESRAHIMSFRKKY